jgi:predicted amidophosphoribosyltransferase
MNKTLIRSRDTQSQVELNASERRINVAGAFEVVGNVAPRVLLIDDVCTTGSTLGAAASALRAAGVQTVYAATVALA